MAVPGCCLKKFIEADFVIWRLNTSVCLFFLLLFQTYICSAITACTLFGSITFRVQWDLIDALIRTAFL